MTMQPRTAHYAFAHKVLPQDVFRRGDEIWTVLSGTDGNVYLMMQWEMAAGGAVADAAELRVAGQHAIGGCEVALLQMPAPEAPTEAHFAAIAKTGAGFRYFAMEKGIAAEGEPPRAFIAEWRSDGSRLRGEDLSAVSPQAFLQAISERLGDAPASAVATPAAEGLAVEALAVAPTQAGYPAAQPMGTQPAGVVQPPMAQAPMGMAQAPTGMAPPSMGQPQPPMGAQGYGYPQTNSMAPQMMPPRAPQKKPVNKKVMFGIAGALGLAVVGGIGFSVYSAQQEAAAAQAEETRLEAIADARDDAREVRDDADERIKELKKQIRQCKTNEGTAAQKVLDQARARRGALVMLQRTPKNLDDLKDAVAYRKPSRYLPEAKLLRGSFAADWVPTHDFVSGRNTACAELPKAVAELEAVLDERPKRTAEVEEHHEHRDDVKEKLEALEGLDLSKPEARKTLVTGENLCMPRRVAVFTNSSNQRRYLWRYRCTATLRWISTEDGGLVAAVSATGTAKPSYDPGDTATFTEIDNLNTETRKAARIASKAELDKKLKALASGEDTSDGKAPSGRRPRAGMNGRLY